MPPLCLKSAKDKYNSKVLEYHYRLNKLENDVLRKKERIDCKNKLLDEQERDKNITIRLTEKSLQALMINSDENCSNKKKITQEELNNS